MLKDKQDNYKSANSTRVLAVSPGVAIGPVHILGENRAPTKQVKISAELVEQEQLRLTEALKTARHELQVLSDQLAHTSGRNEADIFLAQQLMLEDPDFLAEIEARIAGQHFAASTAILQVAEEYVQALAALDNELLAMRASDVRDVAIRVVRLLSGDIDGAMQEDSSHPLLLVARDLTPSDTARLDRRCILGICTVVGGPTTHAAILARALEIPAVAGIDPALLDTLHNGQSIAIDGTQGLLYLDLDEEQRQAMFIDMQARREEQQRTSDSQEREWRMYPGSSADGHQIQILANVGDVEGARAAGEAGAEGIGLLRTEFLFGGRQVFPDKQEQFESYRSLFSAFLRANPLGTTIVARTLDAGADKPFPALDSLIGSRQEANPALGLRGIRIHLAHEELLCQQLRALLLAGAESGVQLHIMFPMITTLEELRRAKALYTRVRQELLQEGYQLPTNTHIGIMVETPAAALMADVLAREVDFFSIGANDLYQYTMAVDRTNSQVMRLFATLEPAVWRSIAQVTRAARTHGKTVAVCGEIAANPKVGPLLAGLGVQELSMSPPAISRVKAALHEYSMRHWQYLAQRLLEAESAEEIEQYVGRVSS